MILSVYRKLFLLGWIIIVMMGCSKNSGAPKDTQLPVIMLNTPANNQTYTAGQTINISGSITDNSSIAEVHIHVTNVATGVKYLDVHLYPGNSTTNFSNQDLTAISGINYKIEVIAVDRSVNEARLSVLATCN